MIVGLSIQPLFSQQKIIKDYVRDRNVKTYCFYPSTLRMINIKKDPSYNELISEIDKLLVYRLDSASIADRSYVSVIDLYAEEGLEEYAAMWGAHTMYIYGMDGRKPRLVGVYGNQEEALMFYLDGRINWGKLPTLLDTFQNNELMDLINLSSGKEVVIE